MWIATPTGFYSAVAHKFEPELVVVRGRALQDVEALAAWINRRRADLVGTPDGEVEVIAYQQSDYPWRVIATKGEWAAFLAFEVEGITYTNFKDEITRVQGRARHDIYSRVWGVLLGLSKLPNAMKDHGKRAVPHPLYGKPRWSRDDATLWDSYGPLDLDDPEEDDDEDLWEDPPAMGSHGHEDCTAYNCVVADADPEAEECEVA